MEPRGLWFDVRTGRHFQLLQPLSPAAAVAVCRRFSAIFARWLAVAESQRHRKITLSGAKFSKAGDLGDLPASLKDAENLKFLHQLCSGVRRWGWGSERGCYRIVDWQASH